MSLENHTPQELQVDILETAPLLGTAVPPRVNLPRGRGALGWWSAPPQDTAGPGCGTGGTERVEGAPFPELCVT